jgi:hypothetical protein
MGLGTFKDIIAATQGVMTILAIPFALFWFWQRRQFHPKANLTQVITHRRLTETKTLVHVGLQLKNDGLVLMRPGVGYVELCQVVPLPEHLEEVVARDGDPVDAGSLGLGWCRHSRRELALGEHEIEPGEIDVIHCEFVVASTVKTIMVESHIGNRFKRKWRPPWLWLLSRISATRWKEYADKMPKGESIGWNAAAMYDLTEIQGEHDARRDASVAGTF